MTVSLRHVRHRWVGAATDDPRVLLTVCGMRFGTSTRDWAVHEPATSDCQRCYP